MLNLIVSEQGKVDRLMHVDDQPFYIGSDKSSAIQLLGFFAERRHAEICRRDGNEYWLISHAETSVNGEVTRGEYGPLMSGDVIWLSKKHKIQVQALSAPRFAHADRPERIEAASSADRLPSDQPNESADLTPRNLMFRKKLHESLVEEMDLRHRNVRSLDDETLRSDAAKALHELAQAPEFDGTNREQLIQDVLDEVVGYGPLTGLMNDPDVSEIMVNAPDELWVERGGCPVRETSSAFTSEEAVRSVLDRMVARAGRRIDESSPMVDARLPDGSRLNAIIPPLARKGSTITIRKFSKKPLTAERLVSLGAASPEMMEFIKVAVVHRQNICISGGTGTGKTTNLNVFSGFIPLGERIITIEDAAELQLAHPHLVSLEARPANGEGRGEVTIRDLVKNALRMRPDRIAVGECRDGAALDMLQAMTTGHEGSLTTLHAHDPRAALGRLELLATLAGTELPASYLRELIASAIDLIVQISRFSDGSRRIVEIAEVAGMEAGRVQLQTLFHFERTGVTQDDRILGYFTGEDTIPKFYEELTDTGITLDLNIFRRRAG